MPPGSPAPPARSRGVFSALGASLRAPAADRSRRHRDRTSIASATNRTSEEISKDLQGAIAQYKYEEWKRAHPTMEQNAPAAAVTAAAILAALSLFPVYRRLQKAKRTAP